MMTLVEFLVLVLIAAIVGALGQALAGYEPGGFLISTAVGFLGALIGVWLARALQLPELLAISVDGRVFPVLWGIIGSAVFALVVGLLMQEGGRQRPI